MMARRVSANVLKRSHMTIQLKNPELERFIDEKVKAGHFVSPEAAVEAAVEQMMLDQQEHEFDDDTAAAINRAEDQIDRGEGIDFNVFSAEMRKKFVSR